MRMAMAGLYKRVLPQPAVDFVSSDGKQLFMEAIQNGTMEGFYRLISYLQTQSEPAYCGLASLAMVLNALVLILEENGKDIDGDLMNLCLIVVSLWKKVKEKGISFGKLVCLAYCAGAKVEAFCPNQST